MAAGASEMSLYSRICIALFGIAGGIVVLFAIDMTLNSGRFIARSLHAKTPDCSGSCHGPTEQISAPRPVAGMALPAVQAAHRLGATQARARVQSIAGSANGG